MRAGRPRPFSIAGQHIENLTLTGASAVKATGNGLANSLIGNAAANVLNGAAGGDRMEGDFTAADDGIYLDRAVFGGLASGALAAGALVAGTAAADSADRILYDSASGNIVYDADGTGVGAAILFANVGAGTLVTAADFIAF